MGDTLDLINMLRIGDLQRDARASEKLGDLRDKAAYLTKKTGQEPVSWHEFKETLPKPESHAMRNMLVGATIGVGIALLGFGIAVAAILPAITGAVFGALIGSSVENEHTRRNDLVGKYEKYLTQFEQTAGRANGIEKMPPLREGENVARLRQETPAMVAR